MINDPLVTRVVTFTQWQVRQSLGCFIDLKSRLSLLQAAALVKGEIVDGSDAIWNGDGGQAAARKEGAVSDGSDGFALNCGRYLKSP